MAASQPGATGNAQPRLPCAFSRRPEMRPSAFTAIPAWWCCWREWFAAIRRSRFDRPTKPEGGEKDRIILGIEFAAHAEPDTGVALLQHHSHAARRQQHPLTLFVLDDGTCGQILAVEMRRSNRQNTRAA